MAIWFGLILAAYLLGSVPVSYLAAKLSRGIDLRQYGTGQVGAGNLWRITSWQLGLPVSIFDGCKGLFMVWVAQMAGLDVARQIVVGAAAIAGHNWPVFLRFNGGRGLGTTLGVALIVPLINDTTPWATVSFFAILIIGTLALHSSPLPTLLGVAAMPAASWWSHEPLPVVLGYLSILLIIVVKRLTAPRSADAAPMGAGQLLLNRLLFDRDIMDRKTWMYRKPAEAGATTPAGPQQQEKKG